MISTPKTIPVEDRKSGPGRYVPLLYLMQAIPVTIVQELSTVVYKDLGVPNDEITKWTSLIALPWALQMLLGPLVDLTATKRVWIVRTQLLVAVGLFALPFLLGTPFAFELSLVLLAGVAIVSALCNTATDGFYLLATPDKAQQARFAGVQTTAYRFGRLFVVAVLAIVAGKLTEFTPVRFATIGGTLNVSRPGTNQPESVANPLLSVSGGVLIDGESRPTVPKIEIPPNINSIRIKSGGEVISDEGSEIGRMSLTPGAGLGPDVVIRRTLPVRTGWIAATLVGALIYALGFLFNRPRIPLPARDAAAESPPGEVARNVGRTLSIVALYASGYFAVSALWKLAANGIAAASPQSLSGWLLPAEAKFFNIPSGLSGVQGELAQLVLAAPLALASLALIRRNVRNTAMGEAFGSFFRQSGVVTILLFMLFYRFGEAMVAKMSPLFLKDLPSAGGIGLDNEKLGFIKGAVGVAGIVIGGLLGGWTIGRIGLKKALWPLALVMHAPIALYLWASLARPAPIGSGLVTLGIVDFVDQFGYGFGFAGYYVILFRIAQRGSFVTSHYAIGTGLGATFIALAGIASGILQKQFGYPGFFVSALVLTIPGMMSMFFVPIGDDPATGDPSGTAGGPVLPDNAAAAENT